MNLPHLEPLIFAKEVLAVDNNKATILCKFVKTPTLSMFIEASAQASLAFGTLGLYSKVGFLTVAKDIKLLNIFEENIFIIKIQKIVELNNMKQFSFEAFEKKNSSRIVVVGNFTILIQK